VAAPAAGRVATSPVPAVCRQRQGGERLWKLQIVECDLKVSDAVTVKLSSMAEPPLGIASGGRPRKSEKSYIVVLAESLTRMSIWPEPTAPSVPTTWTT